MSKLTEKRLKKELEISQIKTRTINALEDKLLTAISYLNEIRDENNFEEIDSILEKIS